MTEQQIKDAFERLQGALAPPVDVAERVEREVRSRRRRRRAVGAGGAALVLAIGVTGAVALRSGSDHDGRDVVATDPDGGAPATFTLTRADGSSVELGDLTLSCDTNPLGEPADPGTVNLWSPFRLDDSGKRLTTPYVFISVPVDELDGRTLDLPYDPTDEISQGLVPLTVFAAEGGTAGGRRPNEVSSHEAGAAGTVRVTRASCDPEPVLQVEVDATLGSEVGQGTERLVGSYP